MQTIEQVPIAEGLFKWSGNTASLIGTRCASCGTHYFPKSLSCRNPGCKISLSAATRWQHRKAGWSCLF